MNIDQAKNYIKDSVRIYLKKDEFGEYKIPLVRQRPIFLLGAPGIGKTAIMGQVAHELGIALVSYSMTHHTRQSALGLPFIKHKKYEGIPYDISEYTMSEIIASIYETMEESSIREGILFLDEINCVSETLAPSMLQFLQYKVFGKHRVPEGWVVVTAGNPPEYNKSVREFDVATMDRLKILDVEADYAAWKEYAVQRGIHSVIVNYLELKKEHFYSIQSTVRGKSYVTARGWEDLSKILLLYEEEKLSVDETLISQYIRNETIVKEFTAYYDLYNKYKKDYKIEEILSGCPSEQAFARAAEAAFDERLSLLGMLTDKIQGEIKENVEKAGYLTDVMGLLRSVQKFIAQEEKADFKSVVDRLVKQAEGRKKLLESLEKANSLSGSDKRKHKRVIRFLTEAKKELYLDEAKTADEAFICLKNRFDGEVAVMKQETARIQDRLHALFSFVQEAFREGNEMLILVTDLTVNSYSSRFIGMFGCEDYQKYSTGLMLSERQGDLQREIEALEL